MSIVITGGAGFIGSCLLWKLNELGRSDVLVVDELGASEKWKNLVSRRFLDYVEKDEFLPALQHGAFDRDVDTIIHFGACSSTTETDASYLIANNYQYSKALAEWAVARGKRFLYASSAAIYGDGHLGYFDDDGMLPKYRPLNMYGYSKYLFDVWVLQHELQAHVVGFRFFNVYGPNEYHKGDMRSMVHKGYEQIKQTGKIRLFKSHHPDYADGEQVRDFIYVKDAVEIVTYFLDHPRQTGIVNVGTGIAQSWNALAGALFRAMGRQPDIEYIDMPEALRGKYQYRTQADMAKLRKTGYAVEPTPLQDAVADYVQALESQQYL